MESEVDARKEAPRVVFDGQCPFCRAYVASLADERGSDHRGVNKIDARDSPQLVAELSTRGIDVNAGIVLIKDGAKYQGAEALSILARQHVTETWLSGLHHRLLRHRGLSRLVYPLLRALRNSYLHLLGRQAIKIEQGHSKEASPQRR
ncbi:MAG: DUF393 domain-containing protein [Porticoccaceae bacterium]|nr:DUF393 domain-containing protein [Porticoccaceae bacterium]